MSRHYLLLALLSLALVHFAAANEPATDIQDKPQWQRMLQGDDAKKAADLQKRIAAADQAGQYDETSTNRAFDELHQGRMLGKKERQAQSEVDDGAGRGARQTDSDIPQ